jgi:hypothetical protein
MEVGPRADLAAVEKREFLTLPVEVARSFENFVFFYVGYVTKLPVTTLYMLTNE